MCIQKTLPKLTIVCAACLLSLGWFKSAPVEATACTVGAEYVAGWGCVKKSAARQAVINCKRVSETTGRKVAFTGCLCQDGDEIGACGN